MEYGLIGEHLGHSFSKEIHELRKKYTYEICEIERTNLDTFMKEKTFKAINVTIPYKQQVIPYLDYIDDKALSIGAVNTIVNKNNKLYGYNTDYLGLKSLITTNNISVKDKKVLLLGNGGTSKTARTVLKDLGVNEINIVDIIKNENVLTYEEAIKYHNDSEIIVNTTPCGMYPKNDDCPVDINLFEKLEAVVDVVYNPMKTTIVSNALKKGLKAVSGLYMLVAQAVYASNIFLSEEKTQNEIETEIERIYKIIKKQKENIVLIGMPSCGKTTIGQNLATILNKEYVDTDNLIEETIKMPIKDFLTKENESGFRDIEEEIIKEISKKNNKVISTGGGIIKRKVNINRLKQNATIIFIDRPLELLQATSSRPLSSNKNDLEKLYNERYQIYKDSADIIIKNDSTIENVINNILNEVK